jgi:hypothetical protein
LKHHRKGTKVERRKIRDEPNWAIIHISMECHKETPHVAILNNQKSHFFSYTKLENRRMEQVLPGVFGTSGRGEEVGKW